MRTFIHSHTRSSSLDSPTSNSPVSKRISGSLADFEHIALIKDAPRQLGNLEHFHKITSGKLFGSKLFRRSRSTPKFSSNADGSSKKSSEDNGSFLNNIPAIKGTKTHEWGDNCDVSNSLIILNGGFTDPGTPRTEMRDEMSLPGLQRLSLDSPKPSNTSKDDIHECCSLDASPLYFSDQGVEINDNRTMQRRHGQILSPSVMDALDLDTNYMICPTILHNNQEYDRSSADMLPQQFNDNESNSDAADALETHSFEENLHSRTLSSSSCSSNFSFEVGGGLRGRTSSIKYYSKPDPSATCYLDGISEKEDLDEELNYYSTEIYEDDSHLYGEIEDEQFKGGFSSMCDISTDESEGNTEPLGNGCCTNGDLNTIPEGSNYEDSLTSNECHGISDAYEPSDKSAAEEIACDVREWNNDYKVPHIDYYGDSSSVRELYLAAGECKSPKTLQFQRKDTDLPAERRRSPEVQQLSQGEEISANDQEFEILSDCFHCNVISKNNSSSGKLKVDNDKVMTKNSTATKNATASCKLTRYADLYLLGDENDNKAKDLARPKKDIRDISSPAGRLGSNSGVISDDDQSDETREVSSLSKYSKTKTFQTGVLSSPEALCDKPVLITSPTSTPPSSPTSRSFSRAGVNALPPIAISRHLKYHDLHSSLDAEIKDSMGTLFFIDEAEEDSYNALQGRSEEDYLDEINNVPEDFTFSDNEDTEYHCTAFPRSHLDKFPYRNSHSFSDKPTGFVKENAPVPFKLDIKEKTVTFFKNSGKEISDDAMEGIRSSYNPCQSELTTLKSLNSTNKCDDHILQLKTLEPLTVGRSGSNVITSSHRGSYGLAPIVEKVSECSQGKQDFE
ncbi:HGR101Wp [Eremothecium sinecaudum]|uniref:HGR101Wp n=1 Tax=Eremothecium sinecaudum TaxID=45286 RepID=A0A120K2S3_9SACH|nr:HGR101Wp [Eremothecium sinecaudum]AMD22440.1 HGR101Wp [Eremothecium sinecaudum]